MVGGGCGWAYFGVDFCAFSLFRCSFNNIFYTNYITIVITYITYIMKAIKRLFSNTPYIPASELCSQYLQNLKLSTPQQLPVQYYTHLGLTLTKCEKPHEFLSELLKVLAVIEGHGPMLKILTIIHAYVMEREYWREDMQGLEEFEIRVLGGMEGKEKEMWFVDFCRSYVTYLMKLPALSDVYIETTKKQYSVKPQLHLTHIFRITNTVRILFPAVTNAVNVIGRYQASKHAPIKQLFLVLSGQLVKLYSYIRYLCEQILKQYRVYNPKDLRCFIDSLPELELLCDKIEDLLVNKYLKGRKIAVKIEFKEERVAELLYYLDYQYNGNMLGHQNGKVINT